MIKCGFINDRNNIEIKELYQSDIDELLNNKSYFSINMDNSYYIFIARNLYNEKDMSDIAPLLTLVNKKLLLEQ